MIFHCDSVEFTASQNTQEHWIGCKACLSLQSVHPPSPTIVIGTSLGLACWPPPREDFRPSWSSKLLAREYNTHKMSIYFLILFYRYQKYSIHFLYIFRLVFLFKKHPKFIVDELKIYILAFVNRVLRM